MTKIMKLFYVFLLLCVACKGEETTDDSIDHVLELTDSNFEEAIQTHKNILVEFYAPWCGHCKSLEPEYKRAAEILSKDEDISLAKLDATANEETASRYQVTGYPTLMLFKNGQKHDFDGERTVYGIVKWMKDRSAPDWKPAPSTVLVLTVDNFTDITKNSPLILVEFYAPWCGHCKRLEPEYEKASAELSSFGIKLAKVNAEEEHTLKSMFQINGFPTLKVFRKGREFEYKGPRDAQGIIRYMKGEALAASDVINEFKQLDNIIKSNNDMSTVVGFFKDAQEKLFIEYEAATNDMRGEHNFLHSFQTDLAKQFKVKLGTIVVFKPELLQSKYEKPRYFFDKEDATSTEIADFIKQNVVPLVGFRHKKNMKILYDKLPIVVVYYDVNFSHAHRKATQLVREEVLKVAKSHPKIRFAISREDEFEDELKGLGLDDSGEDVNVGYYAENSLKYPMEPQDGFDSEMLEEFVSKVLANKVKPYFKSQPIPKKNDDPVKIIVANTFEKLVLNNDRNVLIEFYAPWCKHCQALEKTYSTLAKKLIKEKKDVVVAKMDATVNDVPPQFDISGFPSIYFVPKNKDQEAIPFELPERNLTTLYEFVIDQLSSTHSKDKDEL